MEALHRFHGVPGASSSNSVIDFPPNSSSLADVESGRETRGAALCRDGEPPWLPQTLCWCSLWITFSSPRLRASLASPHHGVLQVVQSALGF